MGWCGCRYRGRSTTSIGGREGLTLVRGGNGVGATSEYLIAIDTIDGDEVDDDGLSLGGSSLTTSFFLPTCPFSTGVMWRGQGRSAPPDDIAIYTKITLQIIIQIEYWDELKLDN